MVPPAAQESGSDVVITVFELGTAALLGSAFSAWGDGASVGTGRTIPMPGAVSLVVDIAVGDIGVLVEKQWFNQILSQVFPLRFLTVPMFSDATARRSVRCRGKTKPRLSFPLGRQSPIQT